MNLEENEVQDAAHLGVFSLIHPPRRGRGGGVVEGGCGAMQDEPAMQRKGEPHRGEAMGQTPPDLTFSQSGKLPTRRWEWIHGEAVVGWSLLFLGGLGGGSKPATRPH